MHGIAAGLISALYALCSSLPLQDKVTLLSRQGRSASLDFYMLENELKSGMPNVRVVMCLSEPESVSKSALALSLPKMIYHVATSRVCVLEGYIPAVSIPRLRKGTRVIQLWHALGAIKKFGFQSVGTSAGRTTRAAEKLRMHANYDWVVAAALGAVSSYAEAFGYDEDKVRVLGMPRMDYLLDLSDGSLRMTRSAQLRESYDFLSTSKFKVLYAPTIRQDKFGWMSAEVKRLSSAFEGYDCELIISGHSLDVRRSKAVDSVAHSASSSPAVGVHYIEGVGSIDLLGLVDCVITDYSAVSFEAAIAGKPVWFYVPDIEEYRKSPGLNIDPMIEFPDVTFDDAYKLAAAVFEGGQIANVFSDFCYDYFGGTYQGGTQKIVDLIRKCYHNNFDG